MSDFLNPGDRQRHVFNFPPISIDRAAVERSAALMAKLASGCQVYWGSHGCDRPQGHEGPCICLDCLYDADGQPDWDGYVGMPPYYGPKTRFWGEDARTRGLLQD